MTLLYLDDSFTEHKTGDHPECVERIVGVNKAIRESALVHHCLNPVWDLSPTDRITKVHSPDYVARLEKWDSDDAGQVEADTIVGRGSYSAARRASGAACDAVRRIVAGEDRNAFCAVRPPGHHALADAPMGFCLINHVAIAARYALTLPGIHRVLIVDWDIHHGNGTQDAFWKDDSVGFFSSHRAPFYPGTGAREDIGEGAGKGFTRNMPVKFGITASQFVRQFEDDLSEFAERVSPDLIVVSAGFDAHCADPVGGLSLEEEHFASLTDIVASIAKKHSADRLVSLLEGGYHLKYLPLSVVAHLERLV